MSDCSTENVAEALFEILSFRRSFKNVNRFGSSICLRMYEASFRDVGIEANNNFNLPSDGNWDGGKLQSLSETDVATPLQRRTRELGQAPSPLLFVYGEVLQGSTGFAPFELLFGRTIRGPMQILKEL